jgi:hypothetical protein
MSPISEINEPELPGRRDIHQSQRARKISVSGRGFHRPDHRFSAHGQTGQSRCQTLLSQGFRSPSHPIPRVINVDKNAAYAAAIKELKRGGKLPRRVRLRPCKFLNNVIEQDHRNSKKRVWLAKGYGSFPSARRTLEGIETMHMIRKGRVRRVAKKTWWPKQDLWRSCSASLPNLKTVLHTNSPSAAGRLNFATKSS